MKPVKPKATITQTLSRTPLLNANARPKQKKPKKNAQIKL